MISELLRHRSLHKSVSRTENSPFRRIEEQVNFPKVKNNNLLDLSQRLSSKQNSLDRKHRNYRSHSSKSLFKSAKNLANNNMVVTQKYCSTATTRKINNFVTPAKTVDAVQTNKGGMIDPKLQAILSQKMTNRKYLSRSILDIASRVHESKLILKTQAKIAVANPILQTKPTQLKFVQERNSQFGSSIIEEQSRRESPKFKSIRESVKMNETKKQEQKKPIQTQTQKDSLRQSFGVPKKQVERKKYEAIIQDQSYNIEEQKIVQKIPKQKQSIFQSIVSSNVASKIVNKQESKIKSSAVQNQQQQVKKVLNSQPKKVQIKKQKKVQNTLLDELAVLQQISFSNNQSKKIPPKNYVSVNSKEGPSKSKTQPKDQKIPQIINSKIQSKVTRPSSGKKQQSNNSNKLQKQKQSILAQLSKQKKISLLIASLGEVAAYCSKVFKKSKSKLVWQPVGILMYKECSYKFKQADPLYERAMKLHCCSQEDYDKKKQENQIIARNLDKLIKSAKQKGKISAEHIKILESNEPIDIRPIIQKEVISFAKQALNSSQKNNVQIMTEVLRMLNGVCIIAYLSGKKIQYIEIKQNEQLETIQKLIIKKLDEIDPNKLKF